MSRDFLRVFFFQRVFASLLRTRAPRKEYSDELGSQNDSKMEVKSEPRHHTAAGANLSQTLPGMSGLHVDPSVFYIFLPPSCLAFWSDCFCYKIVDSASQVADGRSLGAECGWFLPPRGRKKAKIHETPPANVRSAHARQCLREVTSSCGVELFLGPPPSFLSKWIPKWRQNRRRTFCKSFFCLFLCLFVTFWSRKKTSKR